MNEPQKNLSPETKKQIPLRVALLASKYTLSEYSVLLQRLLVGLADLSICSALVCPSDAGIDSIVSPGVEVIKFPFYKLPFLGHYNRKILIEELEKFNPTVLHCLGEDKAALARQLAKQLNIPYLLTINSLHKKFAHLSLSSKRLAQIIVSAESLAADIAEIYPKFSSRIRHINPGTFVSESTVSFSQSTQLPSLVTTCPLKEKFNFSKLLGAVRHLAIDRYEFMLIIISNGRTEKQLRAIVSATGLSQNVIVIPRLQPWRKILAAGDIFIQTWPCTFFNVMLLEAMSVGAVVAGCKGGVDDLIIEDETAVIFDSQDELSIYNCLRRLLDSPEKTRKIARQAQQYVRQNHSVSKMITETLQLYNEAMQWYKKG